MRAAPPSLQGLHRWYLDPRTFLHLPPPRLLHQAIYPGAGARFARHIDNTADDGRRLTMLCYLNPHWKKHHGGALRCVLADAVVGLFGEGS